jgi:hypothetical protein
MAKNDFGVGDTSGNQSPSSELDIYDKIIESSANDEFLSDTRLGLGYYTEREMWLQVQSYKKGMYGDAAFARRLITRAIDETKTELGLQGYYYWDENDDEYKELKGWEDLSDDEQEKEDRRRWVQNQGERNWRKLRSTDKRLEAMEEFTGIGETWTPPFWRMLEMRHEASRSRGARLIDNAMGRVKKLVGGGNNMNDQAKDELGPLRGGEQ